MNKNLEKFQQLLLSDNEFQQKLKSAAESYDGEKTEEAVFANILMPVAQEYGIEITYDEYKEYAANLSGAKMSDAELAQVAGGDKGTNGGGIVKSNCTGLGVGYGAGAGEKSGGICLLVGIGWGDTTCVGPGYSK